MTTTTDEQHTTSHTSARQGMEHGGVISAPVPTRNHSVPMLMSNTDLPGPLSMNLLSHYGALRRLDDINAYLCEYSDTLFGRGLIMTNAVPHRTIAGATTAAWVWLGGRFPDVINVISHSHYRTMVYGRPIRAFNRRVPESQISRIAGLRLTSPTRTACDIALMDEDELDQAQRKDMACAIMQDYHVQSDDCLAILNENRFWANSPQARAFFTATRYCF